MAHHLVLIGLMGVGKTTVGKIVAERLGRELVDSDLRIEALTGTTVKEILAAGGVSELRRHEAEALFDALADDEPRVIGAAAGVVLDADHRRRLVEADATVVWLTGDPELLGPRTASRGHRPWLDDDPVATLQRMLDEREHLYLEVADAVVDVGDRSADQVADLVLRVAGA
jgi:shikimate kinase